MKVRKTVRRVLSFASQEVAARWPKALTISRLQSIWREIIRLIKYGIVGLSNTAVSMAVLNLFFYLYPPVTPAALVLGSTTAYTAGEMNSFWWNRGWTFGVREPNWGHFLRFSAVAVVCTGINAALVWGSSGWLLTLSLPGWLLSNAYQISGTIAGTVGYLALRLWVFKPARA